MSTRGRAARTEPGGLHDLGYGIPFVVTGAAVLSASGAPVVRGSRLREGVA